MDVQLAVLADSANLSQEGKLNILGEFDTLWAPEAPVSLAQMCFVAKVRFSRGDLGNEGFVALELRVVDDDGGLVAPLITIRFIARPEAIGTGEPLVGPIIVPIVGATFERFGTYSFELREMQGPVATTIPLHVRQRTA